MPNKTGHVIMRLIGSSQAAVIRRPITIVPTTSSTTECVTASLDPLNGRQVGAINTPLVLAGTNANGELPPQCSTGVSLRTALRTRSGRGRFYLPVYSTNECTAGRVAALAVTQTLAAAHGMMESLITAGLTPIVYHRANHTSSDIVSIDVSDVFDTQRRRRDKLVPVRSSVIL